MNIHKWRKVTKQHQLCYQYLGFSHLGQTCSRIETCGTDACKEIHNRIFHGKQISVQNSEDEKKSSDTINRGPNNPTENSSLSSKNAEEEQSGNSA